jgi:hypothetical protein
MNRVHLGPCVAYDVSGKCQNFLDSFLICESYFWTEVVQRGPNLCPPITKQPSSTVSSYHVETSTQRMNPSFEYRSKRSALAKHMQIQYAISGPNKRMIQSIGTPMAWRYAETLSVKSISQN